MLTSLLQRWHLIRATLWFRVVGISVLSIVAVLAAKLLGPVLPHELDQWVGAQSADQLLDILSSSMLAVTTFSLSVMVTVYRSISSQWTPRAHRIQLRDRATQTVLATFVGAFVYALCSIVLRSTRFFADRDIVVLFVMTLGVIVLVVVMILRWLVRLQTMGSLSDIAGRITDLTLGAFQGRMAAPCLGARALTSDLILPETVLEVHAPRSGYVERVFPAALQSHAKACGGIVYLLKGVGDYVSRGEVFAQVTDASLESVVLGNVHIGSMRDIEQDPGFGLHVLAEIGSKALSQGINDGGTAIDMIDRITRVLESWLAPQEAPAEAERYPNVYLPPLDPAPLVADPFGLIARDGAAVLEVQMVLQSRLFGLEHHPDPDLAAAARHTREEALVRATEALPYAVDRDRLAEHAEGMGRRSWGEEAATEV
ncbi:DUF2254 domain-containing protein [Pseudodonghicola xiamenensis]|uniref:DUF2254 domain-containing protein n=1 Tax=Pseudodonghicola xiamenensis TaxID=337702 RepID=A0A8J3H4Z6_9RHOB|nr:DUF2254 domain-containing protein [Pseudodonghicola xiamenensis]GHG80474.1 hypothetical protein GCM10010961_03640 [Pseudodonghicola xiamenensis]